MAKAKKVKDFADGELFSFSNKKNARYYTITGIDKHRDHYNLHYSGFGEAYTKDFLHPDQILYERSKK